MHYPERDPSVPAPSAPAPRHRREHVKRLRSYAAWAALILPIVAAGTIVGLGVASQIR